MRPVRPASVLVAMALLAGSARAESTIVPTAAAITERDRTLDYILAQIFSPDPSPGPRTVILLVDPAPSLVRARFAERLEVVALANVRDPSLAVGLAVAGDRKQPRVAPSGDRGPLTTELREILADPESAIRNVYAPIRDLVQILEKVEGSREIVLVTLENGGGEDELERTAESLVRAGVKLDVIGRPALLSDSSWVRHRAAWARAGKAPPGELDLRGQDTAYDELPWGWIAQWLTVPNELVPSGFGMYGLSRLVSRSKGTYFLSCGGLLQKPALPSVGRRAEKLEEVCADLAARLGKALAATDPEATTPRTVALAETTRALLLVTRLNCRLLRSFCDRAEGWRKDPEAGLMAPEIPTLSPRC